MLKFFVALFDLLFGAREPLPDKFFEPPARDAAFQSEAAGEWAPLPRMLLVLKARPPYLEVDSPTGAGA